MEREVGVPLKRACHGMTSSVTSSLPRGRDGGCSKYGTLWVG